MKAYLNEPRAIEERSFAIIRSRLFPDLPDQETEDIVYRVIHTTADFDFCSLLEFKNDPVQSGLDALKKGPKIYVDTKMIREGINKFSLKKTGAEVVNFVHDEEVTREAKKRGVTRSTVALEKALQDPTVQIYAIGNAPTALFTLIEHIEKGGIRPSLIIGVPVGFVGAAESKKALDRLDRYSVPYIRINGEKGGSTVAVAIINALLYRLGREW